MTDLPRLAVPQDDADWLIDHRNNDLDTYVVRLPERPTTPCPQVGMEVPDEKCSECDGTGVVPIPERTRVEVGWWEQVEDGHGYAADEWHPVATATVAEVTSGADPNDGDFYVWSVTLTDVEAVADYAADA